MRFLTAKFAKLSVFKVKKNLPRSSQSLIYKCNLLLSVFNLATPDASGVARFLKYKICENLCNLCKSFAANYIYQSTFKISVSIFRISQICVLNLQQ